MTMEELIKQKTAQYGSPYVIMMAACSMGKAIVPVLHRLYDNENEEKSLADAVAEMVALFMTCITLLSNWDVEAMKADSDQYLELAMGEMVNSMNSVDDVIRKAMRH